jgi:ABC-type branched-subunit amino acid transport system ATPase component
MGDGVRLDQVALAAPGPTVTHTLAPGEFATVLGPAGAGKTRLLRAIAGLERPAQGRIKRAAEAIYVSPDALPRRVRVESLAGRGAGAQEWLLATRLWEQRREIAADLTSSARAAAALLAALASPSPILLLDDVLDRLDPWVSADILPVLSQAQAQARIIVAAVHRAEWAEIADFVLVLAAGCPRYAGSALALRELGRETAVRVSTHRQAGVRPLVEPFEISFEETPDGLQIRAREGQRLTADLLREGYGNLEAMVVSPPRLIDGLRRVIP